MQISSVHEELYERFKNHTMIEPALFAENLALCQEWSATNGLIIECGTWRGGMIGAIAALLGPNRDYRLFDSYLGLPFPEAIDGAAALDWATVKGPTYRDNCRASVDEAREAMQLSGADKYQIVQGWFSDTLPNVEIKTPIAILRIDADWYTPTIQVLQRFWDYMANPYGLIILDDYYVWNGCSKAVHDFLSLKGAMERIRSTPHEVAYIVRGR